MHQQATPSNWAQATAAFRDSFLTRTPWSYVWLPGTAPKPDRFWIDDVPVSEAVFELACRLKNLPAARALWLEQFNQA